MDPIPLFALVLGGILFVFLISGIVALLRRRCPACGKFFSGRVTASSKVADIVTEEYGYDNQREEYRTIRTRQTGHMVTRRCLSCGHSWDRLESSERQLDQLSEAEAEAYRKWHGRD